MIRAYKTIDKEDLLTIFRLNTPKYFDPKEIIGFEKYIDQQSQNYHTIEYKDKIVGGVGYEVKTSDASGRITWIFFHPEYTGFGLGKKAVEYCIDILKQKPEVEKLVVSTSQMAYRFFENLQYKLVRIEKDYWGKGLDLYSMERNVM